jgi:hypothetical protein
MRIGITLTVFLLILFISVNSFAQGKKKVRGRVKCPPVIVDKLDGTYRTRQTYRCFRSLHTAKKAGYQPTPTPTPRDNSLGTWKGTLYPVESGNSCKYFYTPDPLELDMLVHGIVSDRFVMLYMTGTVGSFVSWGSHIQVSSGPISVKGWDSVEESSCGSYSFDEKRQLEINDISEGVSENVVFTYTHLCVDDAVPCTVVWKGTATLTEE